jgi:uncharacterized protein (TIGR02453 family)
MIQKSTLQFLKELKKNNNKEWFELHRKEYETAKNDFLEFIDKLIPKIAAFDPEVSGIKAKDCIFRINRDVRFGKDKTPYKSHFGAAIALKGRKGTYPGYYVHLEPGGVVAGGGAYMLMPDELQKVRQEIDYNAKDFLKIIKSKSFQTIYGEVKGEALVNPPKGYDASNEAIDYIKHKQWYAMTGIADAVALTNDFEKKIIQAFKTLLPLNRFLQKAMND